MGDVPLSSSAELVGEKEECRRIVLDVQDLIAKMPAKDREQYAQKLTEADKQQAKKLGERDQALMITAGKPLSMFDPDSWPACFVDFFYGDACPNQDPAKRPVAIEMSQLWACLLDREELSYTLPTDSKAYVPRSRSRFDTPEFVAIFGDTMRRERIFKGANVAFKRVLVLRAT